MNDAPVAVDDAITATEDTPFTSVVDLDFNDTDLDGDALTVVAGTFRDRTRRIDHHRSRWQLHLHAGG